MTRRDLQPGLQAVQCSHVLAHFFDEHTQLVRAWCRDSDFLALLSVKDEDALVLLAHCLKVQRVRHSKFYEPDIGNELTAIAIEPSDKAEKLTEKLPLALKECWNPPAQKVA